MDNQNFITGQGGESSPSSISSEDFGYDTQLDNINKVRLVNSTNSRERFTADVSPEINENQTVSYKSQTPHGAPGSIMMFNSSDSRSFSLTQIKLIARNSDEATVNLAKLNLIRSWSKPVFGLGSSSNNQNDLTGVTDVELKRVFKVFGDTPGFNIKSAIGAPPAVLLFSAYSGSINGNQTRRRNFHRIPVVLTTYNISYPSDVQYIPTNVGSGSIPFPTLMNIDITIKETHSPNELAQKFDLQKYKLGLLDNF